MTTPRFGWIPDTPDQRDLMYMVPAKVVLPHLVTWRNQLPPAFDQGDLGSCTAQAIAGAMLAMLAQQRALPGWLPSRLFIYYNERVLERTVASDAGAMIRDGIKVVHKLGAPSEQLWPYDLAQFATRPPDGSFANALLHQALRYQRVVSTSLYSLKHAIASHGPVVVGVSVYESFMDAAHGLIPMPKPHEALLGGHAILLTGYDDTTRLFEFRNSWGTAWGASGYGALQYDYITDPDLADDAWLITLMEASE